MNSIAVTTHGYVEADLAMKEHAHATIGPPETKRTRYRPTDALMKFLESLSYRTKFISLIFKINYLPIYRHVLCEKAQPLCRLGGLLQCP
ncbi:hypothetical protein V0M98_22255 [Pseudomonas silesiensis]|uniref:hypothetical protein n=1 Tax=Pseudomonas silesiensis TaxID=1853130 RepID=UPI0030CE1D8F